MSPPKAKPKAENVQNGVLIILSIFDLLFPLVKWKISTSPSKILKFLYENSDFNFETSTDISSQGAAAPDWSAHPHQLIRPQKMGLANTRTGRFLSTSHGYYSWAPRRAVWTSIRSKL